MISVTGDIAFSGTEQQYALAERFLRELADVVGNRVPYVELLLVPGNHDCHFPSDDKARTIILDRLTDTPDLASTPSVIQICTAPQANFFSFRSRLTTLQPKKNESLWVEYEIQHKDASIRISGINAAWASRLNETAGQLVFPIRTFENLLAEPSDLRVIMLHHPLNWYTPDTYQRLRNAVRSNASVVLTGHEHVNAAGQVIDRDLGTSLYFEADALQPDGAYEAGFCVLTVDTNGHQVCQTRYQIDQTRISQKSEPRTFPLPRPERGSPLRLDLTESFSRTIADPGGDFQHPEKTHLTIDDIFVHPDLTSALAEEDGPSSKTYRSLFERLEIDNRVVVIGDEKAGKTTLLLQTFAELHRKGYVPIFLRASEISSTSEAGVAALVTQAFEHQYLDAQRASQSEVDTRVLLIDDLERLKGGSKAIADVLKRLGNRFERIVISASADFGVAELVSSEATAILQTYATYKIEEFGHRRRLDLISKWCLCGSVLTLAEFDQEVHRVEDVINVVVGKKLVPSRPFFLLILLQSYGQGNQSDLQNSGFAHYYHYLITASLEKAGVRRDNFNELFNYIAHLAWFAKENGAAELALTQLREFNCRHSRDIFTVDLSSRLDLLCRAKILAKRGEYYSFTYPYIFYFFVGKYLANNLDDPVLKERVGLWCANLNLRENANTILFLTHHRNDRWVITQVADALEAQLGSSTPLAFGSDVSKVNELIDSASSLVLVHDDVRRNQEVEREERDLEENGEDRDEAVPGLMTFVIRVNRILRTARILGQILKNYYGSLDRGVKQHLIDKVIRGHLIILGELFEVISADPSRLVREIEANIKRTNPRLLERHAREQGRQLPSSSTAENLEASAKKLAFGLLRFIGSVYVMQAGQAIGSERLDEDVSAFVKSNSTNANRLVEIATRMMRGGQLPTGEISALAKELEGNPLAFAILQALGAYHLQMFHTRDDDKQRLCEYLKISMQASRSIDLRGQGRKLLKR